MFNKSIRSHTLNLPPNPHRHCNNIHIKNQPSCPSDGPPPEAARHHPLSSLPLSPLSPKHPHLPLKLPLRRRRRRRGSPSNRPGNLMPPTTPPIVPRLPLTFKTTFQNKASHSSNASSSSNLRNNLSTLTKNIAIAGTGTFASTLLALYLATVVESSAHETLYDYFPNWYCEVREEDRPVCLRERELLRWNRMSSPSVDAIEGAEFVVGTSGGAGRIDGLEHESSLAGLSVDHTQMMDCLVDDSLQTMNRQHSHNVGTFAIGAIKADNDELPTSSSTTAWLSWGERTFFSSSSPSFPSTSTTCCLPNTLCHTIL